MALGATLVVAATAAPAAQAVGLPLAPPAWAAPAPIAPAPESAPAPETFTARVVELTNAERAAAGVAPVAGNAQLTTAAQRYAEVMAATACFGHACGPRPRLGDRAGAAGDAPWAFLGENVAAGQPTPERVVAAWMASPTHRAVLLDPEFTHLGVGRTAGGPAGIHWVQEFGAL